MVLSAVAADSATRRTDHRGELRGRRDYWERGGSVTAHQRRSFAGGLNVDRCAQDVDNRVDAELAVTRSTEEV
jgi:hypothetical protein